MKKYVLFIFGTFEDHEDIQYFCLEVFGMSPMVSSIKYVIENTKNIIVIFESNQSNDDVLDEVHSLLDSDNILFYFLFEMDDLLGAHIPKNVRDFIFKPSSEIESIKIETILPEKKQLDLDELLEKIEKSGVNSLTYEEKKFLDNFDN